MNLQELLADVFDHMRGMWRYRWWAVSLAWLLSIGGWFYVYTMPDIYRALTRVYVDTDSILRPLMQGLTAPQNTMNEVQLLTRVVLTRPNLEKIAYATDLDLRARSQDEMEALITRLQSRIEVSGGQDNVFTMQYEDASRAKARDVVEALLDTFVEGALGDRGTDVEISERALANEIEIHERRLEESEGRLALFKQENIGYMPGETGDYYSRLQGALSRLSEIERELELTTTRRDELRRQIAGEDPVFGIMPLTGGGCSHDTRMADLEAQLDRLRVQYTDSHPRILTLTETLEYMERECESEREVSVGQPSQVPPTGASSLDTNPVYQNLRIQLSDADVQIAGLNSQLSSQQVEVERLRQDVDKITEVEVELRQLNRDYEVIRTRHQELLKRWEDLQAKVRLDPVTDGVQFRTIEPPFALADPVGPNRPLLLGMVLILSVGTAGALAFGLNQINPVFFTGTKLKQALQHPVIGSVTMILPPSMIAKRRIDAYIWGAVCVSLLVATGVAVTAAPWAGPMLRNLVEGVGM